MRRVCYKIQPARSQPRHARLFELLRQQYRFDRDDLHAAIPPAALRDARKFVAAARASILQAENAAA